MCPNLSIELGKAFFLDTREHVVRLAQAGIGTLETSSVLQEAQFLKKELDQLLALAESRGFGDIVEGLRAGVVQMLQACKANDHGQISVSEKRLLRSLEDLKYRLPNLQHNNCSSPCD